MYVCMYVCMWGSLDYQVFIGSIMKNMFEVVVDAEVYAFMYVCMNVCMYVCMWGSLDYQVFIGSSLRTCSI